MYLFNGGVDERVCLGFVVVFGVGLLCVGVSDERSRTWMPFCRCAATPLIDPTNPTNKPTNPTHPITPHTIQHTPYPRTLYLNPSTTPTPTAPSSSSANPSTTTRRIVLCATAAVAAAGRRCCWWCGPRRLLLLVMCAACSGMEIERAIDVRPMTPAFLLPLLQSTPAESTPVMHGDLDEMAARPRSRPGN